MSDQEVVSIKKWEYVNIDTLEHQQTYCDIELFTYFHLLLLYEVKSVELFTYFNILFMFIIMSTFI